MAKQIMIVNSPVPFNGTKKKKKKNFRTHQWSTFDGIDYNCAACDCKPWHAAASYPCGEEPPRQNTEYKSD